MRLVHPRNIVETRWCLWESSIVKTLMVDDQQRVVIPDAKPRQVFAYERQENGRILLTLVAEEQPEAFPPGSLAQYVTAETDAEMLELLKGCSLKVMD
jgi:hypothetical protein